MKYVLIITLLMATLPAVAQNQPPSSDESQRLPAIIHYPGKPSDACENIIEYTTIYTLRNASGNRIGVADMEDAFSGGRTAIPSMHTSSNQGDPWVEVLGADDTQLSRPPLVGIATAVAKTYGVKVLGETDHSNWRRAWTQPNGLPTDMIQPKTGHTWGDCFPGFTGSSRPFEGSNKTGNLSAVGVFTSLHDINIGVPCPELVPQTLTIHERGTPVVPSCDHVLGFNGLDGKTVLFLYRGTRLPSVWASGAPVTSAANRKLCRVRYKPGQQYAVSKGYGIDDILRTASNMPVLLDVEQISNKDYAAAINQFIGSERQQFLRIPIYRPEPTLVASALPSASAVRTAAVPTSSRPPTPPPPPVPSPISRGDIEAAIAQNRARKEMARLWRVQMHVFGDDVAVFNTASGGTASLTVKDSELFIEGCDTLDKCARSAAFSLDMSSGKAAGAIAVDGHPRIYAGDYRSEGSLPDSLKIWLAHVPNPHARYVLTTDGSASSGLRADISRIDLIACPPGSRHPNTELQTVDGKQRLAFRAECGLDDAGIKSDSDCPDRFSFDKPGRCVASADNCPSGWDEVWGDDGRYMWCFKK